MTKRLAGLVAATCLFASPAVAQSVSAALLWRTDTADRPEAVHVPADGQWAYIGNQSGNGDETDPPGIGYIARLHVRTGVYEDRWAEGFDGPLGIVSDPQRIVFVDNGNAVIALDRRNGEVLQRWAPPAGDVFLNDIALDEDGRIWVTDTRGGGLYRLEGDSWTLVHDGEDFTGANGVEFVDGWIYVVCSSGVGNLIRINPDSLDYDLLLTGEGSLDGVVTDGRGGLLLGDLRGRLLHWSESGGVTVLDGFDGEGLMVNSIGGTPDGAYTFSPHWAQSQISAHAIEYDE